MKGAQMLQELLVAERSIQDSLDSPVSELKSLVRFADRKKSELLSYISALEKLLPIPSNAEFESGENGLTKHICSPVALIDGKEVPYGVCCSASTPKAPEDIYPSFTYLGKGVIIKLSTGKALTESEEYYFYNYPVIKFP